MTAKLTKKASLASAFCSAAFMLMAPTTSHACDFESNDFGNCISVGAGFGLSMLESDTDGSSWDLEDDGDSGYRLFLNYQFHRNWYAELVYADLGQATFMNAQPLMVDEESIGFKATSLFAGYLLPLDNWFDWQLPVDFFAKAGASKMSNSISTSMLAFDDADATAISFGAGVLWQFHRNWQLKSEFESFSADAKMLSVSAAYTFAGSASSAAKSDTATEPTDAAKAKLIENADVTAAKSTAETITLIDADADGIADDLDLCPGTINSQTASANGCVIYTGTFEPIHSIARGSSELSADARKNLDVVAKEMLDAPDTKIAIYGHTDNVGSDEYNQVLSEQRAETAGRYLMEQGIAEENIEVQGLGETSPIADNDSDSGRSQNRRVEVKVSE